jgi:hypothetical protein
MFLRTSDALLSISSKIAGRSCGARRCLFAFALWEGGGSPMPKGFLIRAPVCDASVPIRKASLVTPISNSPRTYKPPMTNPLMPSHG